MEKDNESSKQSTASNIPKGDLLELANSSGTYLLLIENPDGKEKILNEKRIYVYDKTNNIVILEDFIPYGKAFWKSDIEIQIEKYPGMISKDESKNSPGYIYNVSTHEKTEIK